MIHLYIKLIKVVISFFRHNYKVMCHFLFSEREREREKDRETEREIVCVRGIDIYRYPEKSREKVRGKKKER